MDFTVPTPEPKPWPAMRDSERKQFFTASSDKQPADISAFRALLAKRRKRPPSLSSDPDVIRGEALAQKVLSPEEFEQGQKLAWAVEADVYNLRLTRDAIGKQSLIKEIGHPAGREGVGGSAYSHPRGDVRFASSSVSIDLPS